MASMIFAWKIIRSPTRLLATLSGSECEVVGSVDQMCTSGKSRDDVSIVDAAIASADMLPSLSAGSHRTLRVTGADGHWA